MPSPRRSRRSSSSTEVKDRLERVAPAPRQAGRGVAALAPDRAADPGGDRRPPARDRAARADETDPEGTRRGRRRRGDRRAGRGHHQGRHAAGHRGAGAQGAEAPRADERGERRVLDGTHLSRHADRAALVEARRRVDRHPARARHPRRRPLRAREDQEAHRRVPRGAQAEPRGPQPDPVLRRASGRRQDLARPEHRPCAGTQVPAHQPRRHARRSRDPRPPAHLHRRAARQHHPGRPQGGHPQPGADARRDRQARLRHPGRPGLGAARSARSRSRTRRSATTTSACRSTCRRCSSSPPRTSSTRSRGRCATAWRSSS